MGSFTLVYPRVKHLYFPAFGFMACSRIRRIVPTWPWQVQEFRALKSKLPMNSGLNFLTVTSGSPVSLIENVTLGLEPWKQLNSILAQYAPTTRQGYARVSRTKGGSPFIAYAVINDGSAPGERTGDGAFIPSSP